jgi:hypothetical protein
MSSRPRTIADLLSVGDRELLAITDTLGEGLTYSALRNLVRNTHDAIWAPSVECFCMILERCDANLRHPRFGRTILHDVAGLGGDETAEKSPDFAAMLLDAGAGINERDDVLKSTPLGVSLGTH